MLLSNVVSLDIENNLLLFHHVNSKLQKIPGQSRVRCASNYIFYQSKCFKNLNSTIIFEILYNHVFFV